MRKLVYDKDCGNSELIDSNYLETFEVTERNLDKLWDYIEGNMQGIEIQEEDGGSGFLNKDDFECDREEIQINDHLTIRYEESYGGEGCGDDYWMVYSVGDSRDLSRRFFKYDGFYTSYHGGEYEDHFEVFPKEVVKVEWAKS